MATSSNNQRPLDVVVLNTIQAVAADLSLAGGKVSITNLGEAIKVADGISVVKTAYALGTLSAKDYDMTALTILDNTIYKLTVAVASVNNVAGTGSAEADQINAVREYVVSTDGSATATKLKVLFEDRINADPQARVAASTGAAASKLRLTLLELGGGDFTTDTDATETVINPFVAPAGTPAIVEAHAPSQSSASATYTTWTILYNRFARHYSVGGAYVANKVYVDVFADAGAANYAAMETEMDAILDGTHSPVVDYLGI